MKKIKKCKDESLFARNLTFLKKRSTEIWQLVDAADRSRKAEASTGGELPLEERIKKSKLLFYGSENPVEMVRNFIEGWKFEPFDTIFLIGLGLGYLPMEAFKQEIGSPRMIVIEPSIQVFLDAMACIDLDELLKNPRIDLFVGEDIRIADIINQFRHTISLGKNPIIVHPMYNVVFEKAVESLLNELKERLSEVINQWFTIREHGKRMYSNTITNLPSLFAGIPMRRLRGKFKGVPAICVSAGPSLDEAIDELKQIQYRALIIACDSAVNALMNSGITPHVIVTVDIFQTNIHKLKPYVDDLRETVLIFGLESNPDNIRFFLSPKRVAVSSFSKLMSFWLAPQLDLQSCIPQMSSVSHLSLHAALAMGADPIIMVGMDLGYVDGKNHSFGSVFFDSVQESPFSIYGNNGCELSTAIQFIGDKLVIEQITRQHATQFINTSIKGAYIPGTTIKNMVEVIDTEVAEAVNVNSILDSVDWTCAADETRAASELNILCQLLKGARDSCRKNRGKLSEAIHTAQACGGGNLDANFYRNAEKEFHAFEKQNFVYTSMNMELVLDDAEEIFRLREVYRARQLMMKKDASKDQVDLLVRQYDVIERGFDFQIQQIEGLILYLKEVSTLKKGEQRQAAGRSADSRLAMCYHRQGELWRVYREYMNCIEKEPYQLSPYVELIQILIDSKLWLSAQRLLTKAGSMFGVLPEIKRLKQSLADDLYAIFSEIKKEWGLNNFHSTRRLLAEYMTLRPHDSQGIELKEKMYKLDRQSIVQWKVERIGTETQTAMPERLNQVKAYVKEKELEKGIGVLEGMYQDFIENRATIREQIGDIRMMQKDYRSAMWNYKQALKIDPLKLALTNKIERVKAIQETG